jgi:hypothetical protein
MKGLFNMLSSGIDIHYDLIITLALYQQNMIMIPHFLNHLLPLLLYPPDDTIMFQSPYPASAYDLQLDRFPLFD